MEGAAHLLLISTEGGGTLKGRWGEAADLALLLEREAVGVHAEAFAAACAEIRMLRKKAGETGVADRGGGYAQQRAGAEPAGGRKEDSAEIVQRCGYGAGKGSVQWTSQHTHNRTPCGRVIRCALCGIGLAAMKGSPAEDAPHPREGKHPTVGKV